ncbi:LysR substrate-binding domain-containing protein [Chromobacterium haemolyticum]|nr:LysR substrate-binding domain-containing protein [Chromobacterium haemolyticum]
MPKPPLDSLRFFEAAARRLSVKQAAEELHVTPGAVSQQLRKLESFLGQPLFERRARGLALNAAGRDYLDACRQALDLIDHATARLTGARRVILLSCTPSFGAQWLLPRLQGFMREHPHIDVHVSTGNRVVDLASENIHFAVRHGLGDYPGLNACKLLDDELTPVCAPTLPARLDALSGEQLLHDEHRGDWRLWSRAAGLELDCDQRRGLRGLQRRHRSRAGRPRLRAGAALLAASRTGRRPAARTPRAAAAKRPRLLPDTPPGPPARPGNGRLQTMAAGTSRGRPKQKPAGRRACCAIAS